MNLLPLPIQKFFGNDGKPLNGGKLFTYVPGTTTKLATYTDSTGGTPNANPVILDYRGEANVWGDPTLTYKFVLAPSTDTDPPTAPIWSVDNINVPLSIATLLQILYPRTPAEIIGGVTPTSLVYAPGDVRRYGIVPNVLAAAGTNTASIRAAYANSVSVLGPNGAIWFPNTTGSDIYYFNDIIDFRDGCKIELNNCTLSFTKAVPTAHDTSAGCIFAQRDFSIKNGTIITNYPAGAGGAQFCPLAFGARGNDAGIGTYYQNSWDNLLAIPQGNIEVSNMRITNNTTASFTIWLTGGLQNVVISDLWVNGLTVGDGIYCEYGFASNEAVISARQTSHPHNMKFLNIHMKNLTSAGQPAGGLALTGCYNIFVDGLYVNSAPVCCAFGVGEAAFFRPAIGTDNIGAKRNITLRNIVGQSITGGVGIALGGSTTVNTKQGIGGAGAAQGYLGANWAQSTVYVLGQTAYSANSGNVYVCSQAGTSSGAGTGPAGTGTAIVDGTAKWDFIPLTSWVDLLDVSLDGFALDPGTAVNNGTGIGISAGKASIRNGTLSSTWSNGIIIYDECTNFLIEGVKCTGASRSAVRANQGTNNPSGVGLFTPVRLKQGVIRNCFFAGNSVSAAGGFEAIGIVNCDGVLIEANRLGNDVAYNGVAETTQGIAVFISNASNSFNVICRANHVGGAIGGFAYQQTLGGATTDNGNTLQNNTGVKAWSGIYKDSERSIAPLAYAAAMTPDITSTNEFTITPTNAVAFTINVSTQAGLYGQVITFTIRNTTGGALGVATWAAGYKLSAWVQPLATFSRSISFRYDGTNWVEINRTPADVPN